MGGPLWLYLHGFASSPGSKKGVAFADWGKKHGAPIERLDLRVPSFEHLRLSAMMAHVRAAIDADGGERARAVLIGSSLGGLTACRVAEQDPRVCALFLMAPAFCLAERWRERLGDALWEGWRRDGWMEVPDHAAPKSAARSRVDFGFVDELARFDRELGPFPDVRVPTCIVHGTRDDVVDVELSRQWTRGKRHVRLVEVDDVHELGASIDRILTEAHTFFQNVLCP